MNLQICLQSDLTINEKTLLQQYYSNYKKKFKTDSGLDLIIPRDYIIQPHQTMDIHLGIRCHPIDDDAHGFYLYPRSSLHKTKLRLANSVGIIDYEYTGEIIAMVDNIGLEPEKIHAGTKLFQICAPDLKPFNFTLVDSLIMTNRGSNGFGSTGIKINW